MSDSYDPHRLVAFTDATDRCDTQAMRKLASEEPNLFCKLRQQALPDWVVCDAAKRAPPEVIGTLLELGADINEQDSNGFTPLCWAVMYERKDAVTLLLESGADPNLNCPIFNVACQGLDDPIDMAKLLLDHGADINQPFLASGLPPRNVLSEAIDEGDDDIVEFLKSRGAKLPDKRRQRPERVSRRATPGDYASEVVAHFGSQFGKPEKRTVNEIVPSTDNRVNIHHIRLTAKGDCSVLFTTGLNRAELAAGESGGTGRRAELMVELDKSWPPPREALQATEFAWPIQWLFRIAGYAAAGNEWPDECFWTMSNGELPQPLASGSKFVAWLIAKFESPRYTVFCNDGTKIQIYKLFPLYAEEYVFARERGTDALMARFVEHEMESYIDIKRPNVAIE